MGFLPIIPASNSVKLSASAVIFSLALSEFLIEGITTNVDFQLNLLRDQDFEKGDFDIGFLNRKNLIKKLPLTMTFAIILS